MSETRLTGRIARENIAVPDISHATYGEKQ
jgi:hypothetical protein